MTTLAFPMILTALMAIIALIITSIVLWRKRAITQLEALQNISQRLKDMEDILKSRESSSAQEIPNRADMPGGAWILEEPEHTEDAPAATTPENGNVPEKQPQNLSEPEQKETVPVEALRHENTDRGNEISPGATYNIGKSGKIYTEEELELLIKE